jgi:hypothetical protein
MTAGAVNHPPAPVAEGANPAVPADETCEQIKARYGIETGSHADNAEKKSVSYQSHHILQGAATNDLVDYGKAICVLLANSHSGTAHQITTGRQNKRRDSKASAKNMGELKKLSRDDLVESLTKGKGIPQKDAEKLADCLVEEAEDKVKESAKKNKGIDVDDKTPVIRIGACLPAETLVWLNAQEKLCAGEIRATQQIEGRDGCMAVARIDTCYNDILFIRIDGSAIGLAPFHRVRSAEGSLLRADELRPGELLDTHFGPKPVEGIERDPAVRPLLALGVGAAFECRIGPVGLWVELANTGVAVSRRVELAPFRSVNADNRRHFARTQ